MARRRSHGRRGPAGALPLPGQHHLDIPSKARFNAEQIADHNAKKIICNTREDVMNRLIATLFAAATIMSACASTAVAQDNYPSRPVKLLIGFPVGGLLDTVARIVGEKFSSLLGQQFIVGRGPAPAARSPPQPSRMRSRTA